MIRWILAIVGGLAAWRYRNQIMKYANDQLPVIQKKAAEVFGETVAKVNAARPADQPAIPERREHQA
jgi:hypothetical protein